MTCVVVSGALANRPGNAGGASVRAAWVEGLRRLGFEVWFVEQIARDTLAEHAGAEPDGERELLPATATPHVRFFRDTIRRCGLEGRAALLDEDGDALFGPECAELEEVASEAALLVNLGGHLKLPRLLSRFRRRAYVDLDPGFTQIWHAQGRLDGDLARHDLHFTVGLALGTAACAIPTGGIAWRPLPPPVVLDAWPVADPGDLDRFTTVASWRGTFGRLEHDGRSYGAKAHELRRLLDLPAWAPAPLEIALDIDAAADARDLAALREHGWRVVDPRQVVPDLDAYRRYVRGSGGELSVAQGIYVEARSGWLSDRTVRYLAAGRPALVQDTGLPDWLPLGEGLLAFRSSDEALAGARAIAGDYQRHRRRARELAESCFDSDRVLGSFVEHSGVAP